MTWHRLLTGSYLQPFDLKFTLVRKDTAAFSRFWSLFPSLKDKCRSKLITNITILTQMTKAMAEMKETTYFTRAKWKKLTKTINSKIYKWQLNYPATLIPLMLITRVLCITNVNDKLWKVWNTIQCNAINIPNTVTSKTKNNSYNCFTLAKKTVR